jgi:phosphatidylglycerol:prolipoprotein diacylglycerol transferase
VLRVWDGGLSFHGVFVGGFATIAFYAWKNKISFAALCDLIAPSVFLGYFFGRIGCFLNGCCYGHACDLPWAMRFPDEHHRGFLTPPSHPAQLYSAALALILFWAMQRAKLLPKFNQFSGQLTLLFLALYMVERAFMEYFRLGATAEPAFGIPWLSKGQFVSVVVLAIIALLWNAMTRRAHKARPSSLIAQASNVSTR